MQRKNLASKIACVLISASMLVSTTMTALATDGEVYVAEQAEVQTVSETGGEADPEENNDTATGSEITEEESATEEKAVPDEDVTIEQTGEEAGEVVLDAADVAEPVALAAEENGISLAAASGITNETQVKNTTNIYFYYDTYNKSLVFYNKNTNKPETLPSYAEATTSKQWTSRALTAETIVIGNGITGIGDYNFNNFTALKSVTLADSVESIGDSAFAGATSLNSINLSKVAYIGDEAFTGDTNLANVDLSGAKAIGTSAFQKSGITSAVLKSDKVEIGEYAFSASKLQRFSVAEISSWDNYIFADCTNLTSFTCDSAVTSIPEYTFYRCTALTSCSVNGATTVGKGAFYGCTGLTTCEITGVEKIEDNAFYGCTSLKNFDFSKVNVVGNNAINTTGISTIEFGRVEITLADNAFTGAKLTSICYPGSTKQWANVKPSTELAPTVSVHCKDNAVEPKEATCMSTGLETAGHCDVCGEDYSYNEEEYVIPVDENAHKLPETYTTDKEPTCFEEGSESKTCELCEEKVEVKVIPKTAHSWTDWTVVTKPTCTEEGVAKRTCQNAGCTEEETTTVEPNGHTWAEEYTVDKEPTCTEEGEESIHCTVCNAKNDNTVQSIDKLNHDWTGWTVVKEKTCTENGEQIRTCQREGCDAKETSDILAEGHKWSEEYTVDTPATCTKTGLESHYCTVCGEKDLDNQETIPALNHDWTEWAVDKKQTCTDSGEMSRTCKRCEEEQTDTISPDGHKWSEEYTVDTPQTCTTTGSKSIHCTVCDKMQPDSEEIIPADGHDWTEWTVVKAATCIKDGSKSHTCKREGCEAVATDVIPARGHEYSETFTVDKAATCTAEGSKSHHCVRCEDKIDVTVIPANGHSWGQWTTYSAPTVFKEEVQQHTCSVCSKTETSALAGTKLTPTMSVNASKVWLQIGQKTSAFKVSGLANGDSIKSYKSSNANIFTVTRKGVLKAGKNVGTAKLTITLASGVKKVIPVTVQKRQVKTWNIKNLPTKITIKKGSKYKLSPVISLITATSKFTYQSSNKKVATVTKAGKIKAVKKGKAVITVKAGTVTKKVKVTVK